MIYHKWDYKGTFNINVTSRDRYEAESEQGSLTVTMSRNRNPQASNKSNNDIIYVDDSITIDGIAFLILYGYNFHYTDEEIIAGHITKVIMIRYLFSEGTPNCAILKDWDTTIPRNLFHGIVLPFIVVGFVIS